MNTTSDLEDAIRTRLTEEQIGSDYAQRRLDDASLTVENGTFRFSDSQGLDLSSGDGQQLATAAALHIAETTPEEHRDAARKEHLESVKDQKEETGDYRL